MAAAILRPLKPKDQALLNRCGLSLLMPSNATIGERLKAQIARLHIDQAEVARRAKTSDATISNWVKDNVSQDHVKAATLLDIADAVEMDARELLLGERSVANRRIHEDHGGYTSQDLQREALTLAFQLATEADDAIKAQGRTLPPSKRAELTQIAFELLDEGVPRAKVLRFVLAAAA